MPHTPRIILTSPGGKTGDTVAASLRSHGLDVHLLDSPSARKDFPGFVRALEKEVRENGADIIMPVFYPEALAACRDRFPGICIPVDDVQKIRLLDNKTSCCAIAEGLGIPMPWRYASSGEVDRYPVVFKRPLGQGGDSVYFPGSAAALDKLIHTEKEPLVTEFIHGCDLSVDTLRWDGFFKAATYRVLLPNGKGVSTLRESIPAPELEGYARTILESIDYHGVCGFDFRIREDDGKAFFLECNPRFSGGLESAIASGFDIPYYYYLLAVGKAANDADIAIVTGIQTGEASGGN